MTIDHETLLGWLTRLKLTAATLIASDTETDLALLQVDMQTPNFLWITPQPVEASAELRLIGYPDGGNAQLASDSSVRAVNDSILRRVDPKQYLVLAGTIQHGHTGSLVFDSAGPVVGIVI
jgi:S1-C subfamily serine protease